MSATEEYVPAKKHTVVKCPHWAACTAPRPLTFDEHRLRRHDDFKLVKHRVGVVDGEGGLCLVVRQEVVFGGLFELWVHRHRRLEQGHLRDLWTGYTVTNCPGLWGRGTRGRGRTAASTAMPGRPIS